MLTLTLPVHLFPSPAGGVNTRCVISVWQRLDVSSRTSNDTSWEVPVCLVYSIATQLVNTIWLEGRNRRPNGLLLPQFPLPKSGKSQSEGASVHRYDIGTTTTTQQLILSHITLSEHVTRCIITHYTSTRLD